MPYVFFPEREPADPEGVADKFSEALSVAEGLWSADPGDLILDSLNVACRLHSIKIDSPSGASVYYLRAIFTLYSPLDVSQFEAFRFRIAALNKGDPPNLSGDAWFYFFDEIGRRAAIPFGVATVGVYYAKEFRMDSAEWVVDAGFDWTRVVAWHWVLDCINVNPYTWPGCTFWIDVGPFLYKWEEPPPPPPKTWVHLRCEGVVSAQCVIVHEEYSETITVPSDFTVSPPGDWTFRALGEYFDHWMVNGTRYDAREITVTLAEGTETTLTIYFVGAPPPPGPSIEEVAMYLGLFTAVVSIVGLIYSGVTYFME